MKIKTITCHDVYNYGASLQALALQTFLQQNSYEVEVIDYKPSYIDFYYKISSFVNPLSPVKKYTDKSAVFRFMYATKRFLWSLPSLKRKAAFDKFTKRYLMMTRKYSSNDALSQCVPEADTYVVGSDQVWNSVTMLNGSDPAFYLQFAPHDKKRISYAASFGALTISDAYQGDIIEWLKSLDAISVRESTGVDILNNIGLSGVQVCDPVFLLSQDQWRRLLNIEASNQKYILIYNLTSVNPKLLSDAKYLARKMNLPLYSVSPMKIEGVDKNLCSVGPEEFVSLIFNSAFVLTNSFHATAFSIIGRRQFCTYNYHSKGNSSRMHSVLEEMQLLDRLNVNDIQSLYNTPIDYSRINDIIEGSCENGRKWLINNI